MMLWLRQQITELIFVAKQKIISNIKHLLLNNNGGCSSKYVLTEDVCFFVCTHDYIPSMPCDGAAVQGEVCPADDSVSLWISWGWISLGILELENRNILKCNVFILNEATWFLICPISSEYAGTVQLCPYLNQ